MSALSSLGYLVGPSAAAFASQNGASPAVKRANYAAFYSLHLGAVEPQGWLRLYLQKQPDQLGSQLPNVSSPFTGDYWSGEERPPKLKSPMRNAIIPLVL
jgi:hypothetical protein